MDCGWKYNWNTKHTSGNFWRKGARRLSASTTFTSPVPRNWTDKVSVFMKYRYLWLTLQISLTYNKNLLMEKNENYYCVFFFFFLWYWGLNSGPTPWATPTALFCGRIFWHRVLQTICPGWLQTLILLISASWVTRIIGMSLQRPSYFVIFISEK
jgi:hypothetical protein